MINKANKLVILLLVGFCCFMVYNANSKEKELRETLINYTNELAKNDSLEVVSGGWEKRALEITKLNEILEGENSKLNDEISGRDQEIVSLTRSSLRWKGLYVSLRDVESVSDTVIIDPTGHKRYRVDFSFVDGLNEVDGFTLTNPPEANLKFRWTRALNLTTILTKDEQGAWFAYIDSPDTSFVPMDVNVKVDPTIFQNGKHWYNNFWWGVGAAGSSTGMGANVSLSYQMNQDRLFGFMYNYTNAGSLKGITYQARF